jgi:hypothetical protein
MAAKRDETEYIARILIGFKPAMAHCEPVAGMPIPAQNGLRAACRESRDTSPGFTTARVPCKRKLTLAA